MCTLLLEIFDGAGNFVACHNTFGGSNLGDPLGESAQGHGPFTFILPQLSGPPNSYSNAPTTNITDHGRLAFRLLVDNNSTVGKLPAVRDMNGSADLCGFLHFSSPGELISIDYDARHLNGYLDSHIIVTRGLCGETVRLENHGNSPGATPPPWASFTNTAGHLLRSLAPPPNCTECTNGAAFAVNLYCWAWATDGRSCQSQYDDSATIAFALLNP